MCKYPLWPPGLGQCSCLDMLDVLVQFFICWLFHVDVAEQRRILSLCGTRNGNFNHVHNVCTFLDILTSRCPQVASWDASHLCVSVIYMNSCFYVYRHVPPRTWFFLIMFFYGLPLGKIGGQNRTHQKWVPLRLSIKWRQTRLQWRFHFFHSKLQNGAKAGMFPHTLLFACFSAVTWRITSSPRVAAAGSSWER